MAVSLGNIAKVGRGFPAHPPHREAQPMHILSYTTKLKSFNLKSVNITSQKGRLRIVAMFARSVICQSTNIARQSGTSSCLFLPIME